MRFRILGISNFGVSEWIGISNSLCKAYKQTNTYIWNFLLNNEWYVKKNIYIFIDDLTPQSLKFVCWGSSLESVGLNVQFFSWTFWNFALNILVISFLIRYHFKFKRRNTSELRKWTTVSNNFSCSVNDEVVVKESIISTTFYF